MSRNSSSRWHILFFVCVAAVTVGCGDEPTPEKATLDKRPVGLFRARNLGRLHALRDTNEGRTAATTHLVQAVRLSKGAFIDRLNLARLLVVEGKNLEEARAQLSAAEEDLIKQAGDRAAFFYVRGILAKREKNTVAAVNDLREAFRSYNGTHPQISYQLAFALETAGEISNATGTYQQLLGRVPNFRAATYRLSRCLLRLKKTEEAEVAQMAYAKLPEEGQTPTEDCHLLRLDLVPAQSQKTEPRSFITWEEKEADAGSVLLARDDNGQTLTSQAPSVTAASHSIAADLDNDKTPDVFMKTTDGWRITRASEQGLINWKKQLPEAFTSGLIDARFADMDHDGDLDILGINTSGASILRNNGDKTWKHIHPLEGVTPTDGDRFDFHDIDGQNDLDVAFPIRNGGVLCFLNQRDGTFSKVQVSEARGARVVLLEDFNGDGATDLFAAGKDRWQVFLNLNPEGLARSANFQLASSGANEERGSATCGLVHDVDGDGHTDIILGHKKGWRVLRNQSAGAFRAEPPVMSSSSVVNLAIHSLDVDEPALIRVATGNGDAHFRQAIADHQRALWIAPVGRRDNLNSIGTRIELFDGALRASRLIKCPLGVRMGLGRDTSFSPDGLFAVWPQGIRQSVPADNLKDNQSFLRFKQKEGLVASCPFLYTLTENGWQFITDVVGIAPLDEWLPEGAKPALDPQEFVRLPQEALRIQDGRVELSITEELRETTYLDEVVLHWIDHVPQTAPWQSESSMQGRYDPLLPTWFLHDGMGAVVAHVLNESGESADVSATLRENDGDYLHSYRATRPQWAGWVERHETRLTTTKEATHLMLKGRIAWYDSSISFAVSQMGKTWGPLMVLKEDSEGQRSILIEDIGVPAGMDRTMVVKLGDRPLPAGTRLILSGQHRFLWDQIRTAVASTRPIKASPDKARPIQAVLRFHGFSKTDGNSARHEQTYDFLDAAPDDSFERARGLATRLGDVAPLLQHHDDELVVLVAGDRVDISFEVPEIPTDQRRTYFLRITGWAKEGSFHNKTGRAIAPLPFRAMKSYPPASAPPPSASRDAYRATYQTRPVR